MSRADHMDVAAYALGVLDPQDTERFEEHLATCWACAAELETMVPVVELLADVDGETMTAMEQTATDPALLDRTLVAVRHTTGDPVPAAPGDGRRRGGVRRPERRRGRRRRGQWRGSGSPRPSRPCHAPVTAPPTRADALRGRLRWHRPMEGDQHDATDPAAPA